MKNIRLSVIHPSTHLVFDREDSAAITAADGGRPYQVFTVEASSLHDGGRRPLWSCIYDNDDGVYNDATDVGFYLESTRTGKHELFYLSDTKYSPAGGVAHWIFKPVNQDIRMEILVFND